VANYYATERKHGRRTQEAGYRARRLAGVSDVSLTPGQVRDLARVWWLPVALGLLSLGAGVIVLAKPDNSLKTLAVVIGIFILLDGIAQVFMSLSQRTENRGLIALIGILNLIVGVLLIRHPIGGVTVIALFIGIWLVAVGVVRFVMAFETQGDRVWRLVVAVVEIIAGIVIVSSPDIGFATLALLVGFAFIANGVGLIIFGVAMRSLKGNGDQQPPPVAPAV
jgi:uncharacterized membrane protein HdeD (DUF308 family)